MLEFPGKKKPEQCLVNVSIMGSECLEAENRYESLVIFGGILEYKAEVNRNQHDSHILQKNILDFVQKQYLLYVLMNKYYIQSSIIVLTIEDISQKCRKQKHRGDEWKKQAHKT